MLSEAGTSLRTGNGDDKSACWKRILERRQLGSLPFAKSILKDVEILGAADSSRKEIFAI
jgi:hypothetical protein